LCPKTQQRIAGILGEGLVIDGKYRILRVLGTGGMAAVYLAEHTKIGRNVALKLLLPEFVAHPDLVQRVEREARAAGGIDHPNVVEIVDLGTTPEYGPYIAMEHLKGEDLATYTENRGNQLKDVEAADIVRQVLGALTAAHEKGVIHRDLKPENIFLALVEDDRRRVKVLDFGISKLSEAGGALSSLTRTGTVMGTPQYMAPEQAAGSRDQDHRVDIYACGVVLYAVLTGALPYEAENYNLLINDILNKPPIAILSRDKRLDSDLAAIVMKAVSRSPADRYPTAKAMQDAVVGWLHENTEGSTGTRHKLDRNSRGQVPSAVTQADAVDAPEPLEDASGDEDPTTAIEVQGDRPASVGRISSQLPTLVAPPSPAIVPEPGGSLRSNTRTPLGWEHTPGGTRLPPPEGRRRAGLYALGAFVVLLGGGAFATRQLAAGTWNTAVNRAGVPQLATASLAPATPTPGATERDHATRAASGSTTGDDSSNGHDGALPTIAADAGTRAAVDPQGGVVDRPPAVRPARTAP
ncbi:MAG: serine/threonine-protein kinase, partial [Deltaproteobacteria bacterium]